MISAAPLQLLSTEEVVDEGGRCEDKHVEGWSCGGLLLLSSLAHCQEAHVRPGAAPRVWVQKTVVCISTAGSKYLVGLSELVPQLKHLVNFCDKDKPVTFSDVLQGR